LSDDVNLQKLEQKDRLVIAKLLAILRLADALDRSHSSKVKDIKVQIKSRKLKLKIISDQRILLEKWSIETKSEFFEDVFGLKPEITKE
jgi:exopolyphosphatase/guanosine-5'-triphosphate,3'-diphosphate pyrophosphatase